MLKSNYYYLYMQLVQIKHRGGEYTLGSEERENASWKGSNSWF